jgi:hypothetical protein
LTQPQFDLNRARQDWHSAFFSSPAIHRREKSEQFFQPDLSGFAAASAKAVCKPDEWGWMIICSPFPSRERPGQKKVPQCFLFRFSQSG